MSTMKWTAEKDVKLLVLFAQGIPPSAPAYAAAAKMFTKDGTVCTKESIRQQLMRIKNRFKDDPDFQLALDELKTAPGSQATPAKKPTLAKETPKKKRKVETTEGDEDEDEDEDEV